MAQEGHPLLNEEDDVADKEEYFSMALVFYKVRTCDISKETVRIIIFVIMLTITSGLNTVSFTLMAQSMPNYSYFVSVIPIIAYILVFFPLVFVLMWCTNNITREMWGWRSLLKILVIAFFDELADLLITYGAARTSGLLMPILSQLVVASTMLFSFIFLRVRYKWQHYAGAVLVVAAVVVLILLQSAGTSASAGNSVPYNMLVVGFSIPAALSAVAKEVAFKYNAMDIYFLCAWESLFQLLFSLVLLPVTAVVPTPGSPALPINQVWPELIDKGALCLWGYNSVVCDPSAVNCIPDACPGAWKNVFWFILFDILFNIFLLLVIKYGSASLMFAANTASVPVASFMFAIPFWGAQKFSYFNWIALLIIVVGLVIYQSVPEHDKDTGEERPTMQVLGFRAVPPVKRPPPKLKRSVTDIRSGLYSRLGIGARKPGAPEPYRPPPSKLSIQSV